jgi:hypothetical protein
MSAIVSHPSHTWAATHRMLLGLVAFAIAVAATVAIVLMTSAGSSPSSRVQAPGQGQTHTEVQVPAGAQNQGPADTQPRCLQHMGLQYMGVRPC